MVGAVPGICVHMGFVPVFWVFVQGHELTLLLFHMLINVDNSPSQLPDLTVAAS